MARLIEVQDALVCPSPLTLQVGDVLLFRAAGGQVRFGFDVVELLGSFLQGVLGEKGDVLTPLGPPNTVLFRVRQPGRARIEVITGDPFHMAQATPIAITVEF